jgi:multiple sugar transport system permease protein
MVLPYGISEVVAVIVWKALMDPATGLVARSLASAGLPALDWATDPAAGLTLVGAVSIWLHLPFTFLLLYAAILAVPRDRYEVASIDGAGAWQQFRHVTAPAILPTVLVTLIFRYILAFRLFTEVWLLTGGGPARRTEVMAIYLYKQAFTYANFGRGAAMGWIMVVCSSLVGVVYVGLLYRRGFAARD